MNGDIILRELFHDGLLVLVDVDIEFVEGGENTEVVAVISGFFSQKSTHLLFSDWRHLSDGTVVTESNNISKNSDTLLLKLYFNTYS